MFLAQLTGISAGGGETSGWSAPWTVAAIQACTRDHLAQSGVLARELESADVVLLDLVDHLAGEGQESLTRLRIESSASGAQLVVRLHGAWRHGSGDYLDAEGPELDSVWDAADAVLVASRSHLVRLASFGGIDVARTRLAPVAFDGLGVEPAVQAGGDSRARLLVAGETHRAALGPVLEMLAEVDSMKATFEVVRDLQPFQEKLAGARALLVPAAASFGDRSLVDAALRAGVAVVASPFAGAMESPLPCGLSIVENAASSEGWRAALERGLALEPASGGLELSLTCARQEEILRSIWAQRSDCAGQHAA